METTNNETLLALSLTSSLKWSSKLAWIDDSIGQHLKYGKAYLSLFFGAAITAVVQIGGLRLLT